MTQITVSDVFTYIYKIQLNFDNSYQTSSDGERKLLIASWYEILKEYPKEVCDQAVTNALKMAKFAPRIGDIVQEADAIMNAGAKSDEELWAELMQCLPRVYDVSRYLKYEQYFKNASRKLNGIYEKLSPELKLYVVNVSTLIEISELTEDNLRFEKARFFRQMPDLRREHGTNRMAEELLKRLEMPKKPDDGDNG